MEKSSHDRAAEGPVGDALARLGIGAGIAALAFIGYKVGALAGAVEAGATTDRIIHAAGLTAVWIAFLLRQPGGRPGNACKDPRIRDCL